MSYIKLKVRSGGIYIKQKKAFQPIELNLITHPEDNSQKALSLVRDSSIKGLFSYLMGETGRLSYKNNEKEGKKNKAGQKDHKEKYIKTGIENSQDPEIQKLNATLDKMVEISAYKKISEPYITTFFERRDVYKRSKIKYEPELPLHRYNFTEANSTIKIFEKPLKNIFKTDCLGEINEKIKESKITKNDEKYNDLKSPRCHYIPNTNLGKNIKEYFSKTHTDSKPIYQKTIEIINKIDSLCKEDQEFKEKIEKFEESGLFSIFTTGVSSNTRHWVNKNYHKIVRGKPAFIACVDFDVYLSESVFTENQSSDHFIWEEVIQKLRNGPNIARWGEGGIVLIDYKGLDELGCPYDEKDQIFVEIKALRNSGIEIKKYDWETAKEKKSETQKRKRKNID